MHLVSGALLFNEGEETALREQCSIGNRMALKEVREDKHSAELHRIGTVDWTKGRLSKPCDARFVDLSQVFVCR